jgi:hypothetical protein
MAFARALFSPASIGGELAKAWLVGHAPEVE